MRGPKKVIFKSDRETQDILRRLLDPKPPTLWERFKYWLLRMLRS